MGENMDIPEGMKAWVGGAEAPADWDGGPVLLRSGTRGAPSHGANALSWSHPHMEVRGATDLGGDIIAYTPARLASVSSASAETSVGAKQAPTHIWLHGIGDPIGETTWVDDPSPSGCADEEAHAVAYVRADIAASPEPVPATNQAGEVALRAAVASIADDYMTSEVHHPGYVLIPTAKFDELSALATQPATSQEGEIFRLAANLVYRIEAAGALEHEGMNFERWKTTARSLAPSLRSALAEARTTPPARSYADEDVARLIDPWVWDEAERYRVRADEWFAKGRTEPGDCLTDGYRARADAMQAPLLAKAAAIRLLSQGGWK